MFPLLPYPARTDVVFRRIQDNPSTGNSIIHGTTNSGMWTDIDARKNLIFIQLLKNSQPDDPNHNFLIPMLGFASRKSLCSSLPSEQKKSQGQVFLSLNNPSQLPVGHRVARPGI